VLLYLSFRGVHWADVIHIIAHAEWRYITLAVIITLGSYFLRSVRWRILLNAGEWFDVSTVFWANMAGYLGNSFLPARAGELVRSFLISSRSSLSKTFVLTTALGERLLDVIALLLCSSVVLLGVDAKPHWMHDLSRTMAIIAGAGAAAIAILPHTGGLAGQVLRRAPLPASMRAFLVRFVEEVVLGLRAFHHWGRFTGFVFLTAVIWGLDTFGVIFGARALGLNISFPVSLLLLAGLGLGSSLPSTPGYVGIYQFVAVTILTPFGISHDGAMAYILVAQALGYVLVVLFGIPGLYKLQGPPSSELRKLAARA
jgi:glycosyltransferase 2 family protein